MDGADRLFGELGYDMMRGRAGGDRLVGSLGRETLFDGERPDLLQGGGFVDRRIWTRYVTGWGGQRHIRL